MKKVIRLTESDFKKIVRRTITEDKRKKNYVIPVNVLIEEIDFMLNFHYKTNSTFLKYAKDFGEKFNILESVKINLVENIFSENNLILEKFDRLTNKKVITESEFNFQGELNSYFNFIKRSLLYQGGFINESQYNNYNLLNEEGFWSDLGSGISNVASSVGGAIKSGAQAVGGAIKSGAQKVVQGAKKVGSAVVQGAKKVGSAVVDVAKKGYAALQGAWNKLKATGLGAFMEKYRSFLTSNYGAALQLLIEVSTEGFGAVIPVIAWGLLLQYDQANVIAGTPNWFNLIFSIIGTATTGLASKAIGAAMPFFKTAGKAAGSIEQALQWIAKSKFGQFFQPFISKIVAGLGKIPGIIAKAMTWVESIFGKVFGQSVVNFFKRGATAIGQYISKFSAAITKFFKTNVTQTSKNFVRGSKKLVNKGLQKVFAKAGSLSPKIEAYLASSAGKKLSSKLSIATVDKIKKELTGGLKGYTEEQALAYIDKTYGAEYGNFIRLAKTAKSVGTTGKELATSTKKWKDAAQNLNRSGDWSAEHFKTTVGKAQDLVKNVDKTAGLGDKVIHPTVPNTGGGVAKAVTVPNTGGGVAKAVTGAA